MYIVYGIRNWSRDYLPWYVPLAINDDGLFHGGLMKMKKNKVLIFTSLMLLLQNRQLEELISKKLWYFDKFYENGSIFPYKTPFSKKIRKI